MNIENSNDSTMDLSSNISSSIMEEEGDHASPIAQKSSIKETSVIAKDSLRNIFSSEIADVALSENSASAKTANGTSPSATSLHRGDDDDSDEEYAREETKDEPSRYKEESVELDALDEPAATSNAVEQSDKKDQDGDVQSSSLIRSSQLSSVALDESLGSIASQDANAVSDDTGPLLGDAVSFLSPILQRRDSEVVEASYTTPADNQAESASSIEAMTVKETADPTVDLESFKNERSNDCPSLAEDGGHSSGEEEFTLSRRVSTSSQNVCSSDRSPCISMQDDCEQAGKINAADEQEVSKLDGASYTGEGEPAKTGELTSETLAASTFETEEPHSKSLQEESRSFTSHRECEQTSVVESLEETADGEEPSESASSSCDQAKLTNEAENKKPTDSHHRYSVGSSNSLQEIEEGFRSETGDGESVGATVSSWNDTKSLDGRERFKHGGSPMPQQYNDLTSAKKHLNESSRAFTESLRDAAHRRKMKMTRSRDSLAAKEKQHLISLESEKQRAALALTEASNRRASGASRPKQESIDPYKPFKARPVPLTTGNLGTGGQAGVPKVEKKPTTTPFSPLLGPRRKQQPNNDARSKLLIASSRSSTGSHVPFKARPAPRTTGAAGHGGQAGVPKIPKRQSTVPESPQLGLKRRSIGATTNVIYDAKQPAATRSLSASTQQTSRKNALSSSGPPLRLRAGREASEAKQRSLVEKRRAEELELQKQRQFRARPLPSMKTPAMSNRFATSPVLRGLDILGIENSPQATVQTPRFSDVRPYVPHSTVRAKKRAEFDQELSRIERQRSKEHQVRRRTLLEQKRAEVDSLRPKLR